MERGFVLFKERRKVGQQEDILWFLFLIHFVDSLPFPYRDLPLPLCMFNSCPWWNQPEMTKILKATLLRFNPRNPEAKLEETKLVGQVTSTEALDQLPHWFGREAECAVNLFEPPRASNERNITLHLADLSFDFMFLLCVRAFCFFLADILIAFVPQKSECDDNLTTWLLSRTMMQAAKLRDLPQGEMASPELFWCSTFDGFWSGDVRCSNQYLYVALWFFIAFFGCLRLRRFLYHLLEIGSRLFVFFEQFWAYVKGSGRLVVSLWHKLSHCNGFASSGWDSDQIQTHRGRGCNHLLLKAWKSTTQESHEAAKHCRQLKFEDIVESMLNHSK